MSHPRQNAPHAARPLRAPQILPRLEAEGAAGVSLVSCCKNRNDNLVRALPSWLALESVTEIVLVDWSSTTPVTETLAAAGLSDPRIRIVRVEGEGKWVLTLAFNAGFRATSCTHIMKVDADVLLDPGFFQHNPLSEDAFVAGNWRTADEGQSHVNGFFLVARRALAAVGGFNEHIRGYGWDDEDLYTRLTLAGYKRSDVAAGSVTHLDHDDAQRLGEPLADPAPSIAAQAMASPAFHIRRNRFVANVMPAWDGNSEPAPFEILETTGGFMTLKRQARDPSAVPPHVEADAQRYALAELLSWQFGPDLFTLPPDVVAELGNLPIGRLTRIDLMLARRGRMDVVRRDGRYLLLRCDDAVLTNGGTLALQVLQDLVLRAERAGMRCVFVSRLGGLPSAVRKVCGDVPVIESMPGTGAATPLMRKLLYENDLPPGDGALTLNVAPDVLDRMALLAGKHRLPPEAASPSFAVAAPNLAPVRTDRLFIDAQHGLGNRLRAIASAGAIARDAGRELVVVWQPDDHCDCRMADLFDYPGAVIEERFLDRAEAEGQRVLNYMPHEPGAQKDAATALPPGVDVYVRSAFVLRHHASTWESENAFLRDLRPVGAVKDLVASVRSQNDVSVHVRMEGGKTAEHLPYENRANWTPEDHALIAFWRGKSQPAAFAARLDALIAEGTVRTVFLAADSLQAYEAFAQRYGEKLAFLSRTRFDRSADQLRYGLADAILLSRSPRMLASSWSSFSELATRLAAQPQIVETSGKDF